MLLLGAGGGCCTKREKRRLRERRERESYIWATFFFLFRASPERLFLQHTVVSAEMSVAEHLAISVGLDITMLAELAAHYLLKGGHIARAIRLYALSKVRRFVCGRCLLDLIQYEVIPLGECFAKFAICSICSICRSRQ